MRNDNQAASRRHATRPGRAVTATRDPSGVPGRRHRRLRLLVGFALGALVVVIALVGIDALRLWRGIDREDLSLPGAGGGATNFLLVGSDGRDLVGGATSVDQPVASYPVTGERADMMLLVHVPASGDAQVVGIPRDLVVDFEGSGAHRLGNGLGQGPQVLVDAFCTGLGLGLDHVVVLDFDGFAALVDLVGGVEVDFAAPVRDTRTGFEVAAAGTQRLSGAQALALARSRHPEELVDGTWREVPEGSERRLARGGSLLVGLAPAVGERTSSVWGTRSLLDAVSGSVRVDSNADRGDALLLADALDQVDRSGVADLPAVIVDGPVPLAHLDPNAAPVLGGLDAGSNDACPAPTIPPPMSGPRP